MLPHRARLWAILILVALDLAGLIASHAGVAPELLADLRPHVELALSVLLFVLVPALGDAYMVERRRRDPSVPALVDDVTRPLDARLEMIVPPPITAAMTRAELGKELRSHLSLAQAARCTTTCDHGSRCTLPPNHTGGHETEHGCIAYDPRPPSDAGLALALVIVAAALSAALSGCTGQSYRAHAQAIMVTSGGLSVAGSVADAARDAALDAVEAEHPMHGPERTAALEAEAARWRPLGVALDAGEPALLVWSEALRMAHLAGTTDADLLPALAPVAARVLLLYDRVVAILEELDVDGVPALPAVVRRLAASMGGE
jgi:hypothetical protein